MVSRFYKNYSVHLLCLAALVFPYAHYQAATTPTNNNIETWLPNESAVLTTYGDFKRYFGAEEIILVGLAHLQEDDPLVESVCVRLEQLPGIRKCWSPARLKTVMHDFGVSEKEIANRLTGLTIAPHAQLIGIVASLNEEGLQDRIATVAQVREQLEYCQLQGDAVNLAGSPVVVAELDRLGNRSANQQYFVITLLVCLGLLYYSIREWKLAVGILVLTIWSIDVSLAAVHLSGGEMNFILDALSVMVMVFTLAIAVHFLHYYAASMDSKDPLGTALRSAWRPCCLATVTTSIGLASLSVSDIFPVRQFGCAAAFGSGVALLSGLGLTPAVLTVLSPGKIRTHHINKLFGCMGNWVLDRSKLVTAATIGLVLVAGVGLFRLHSKIDPLDFLPNQGRVLSDVRRIQRDLTSTESIEAMVDFRGRDLTFVQKLDEVRMLETVVRQHPAVMHTMSVASFFPDQLPSDPFELERLLAKIASHRGENEYVTDDEKVWRISIRTGPRCGLSQQECFEELAGLTADLPVTLTGIAPLLELAQNEIFRSFWSSFVMAFVIITAVMILSLRSAKRGLVAMIPNLTPIAVVFGTLGWIRFPVDIGMMMTGSIALGIAVDGTFHFLARYRQHYDLNGDPPAAARQALLQTGPPIFQATLISSVGMLALTLSRFGPTVRFGYLMATILVVALVGDLVLLPSLLSLGAKRTHGTARKPHFWQIIRPRMRGQHISTAIDRVAVSG